MTRPWTGSRRWMDGQGRRVKCSQVHHVVSPSRECIWLHVILEVYLGENKFLNQKLCVPRQKLTTVGMMLLLFPLLTGPLLQVLWLCVRDVRLSARFQRILHRVWYQQGRSGMSEAPKWDHCWLWWSKKSKQDKMSLFHLHLLSLCQVPLYDMWQVFLNLWSIISSSLLSSVPNVNLVNPGCWLKLYNKSI